MIYSTANDRRCGGVGLLIHNRNAGAIKNFKSISEKILVVTFEANPELTVMSVYAPTEEASEAEKDKFYSDLQGFLQNTPRHNLVVVAGDFNARIGSDNIDTTYIVSQVSTFHNETNDNGEKLIETCESLSMRIAQQRFPQPRQRQWTWTHPSCWQCYF